MSAPSPRSPALRVAAVLVAATASVATSQIALPELADVASTETFVLDDAAPSRRLTLTAALKASAPLSKEEGARFLRVTLHLEGEDADADPPAGQAIAIEVREAGADDVLATGEATSEEAAVDLVVPAFASCDEGCELDEVFLLDVRRTDEGAAAPARASVTATAGVSYDDAVEEPPAGDFLIVTIDDGA